MRHTALMLLLALAADAAPWQRNIVPHPSAEADANGDGAPDGWQPATFESPARTAWDGDVARTGRVSLRVSDSKHPTSNAWNANAGRWITKAKEPVTSGKTYSLGAWVRTHHVDGSASACIAWWNGTTWLAESYTQKLSGTKDWTHLTVTAKAPPKADGAQVYLSLSRSTGTAWFDDVAMVSGPDLPRNHSPIDIATACNMPIADGPPAGATMLRGVPFTIRSGERACIGLGGKSRPTTSAAAPIGRKCDTLYLLHAVGGRKGAKTGQYELLYDGASTATVPIIAADPRSAATWETKAGKAAVTILALANPHPDRTIRALRVISTGGMPFSIVALTAADGPPALSDLPLRLEVTDKSTWYPFTFSLDDVNLDGIDLTAYLDAPAGKHGFVTTTPEGHFQFADTGKRIRFFGTNIGGPSGTPEKALARTVAARLAKYGVNLLRIHAVDGRWGQIIDYKHGNSRSLRADGMDRLDYFVAELRKRGIYVYFDMLDYRVFLPGDDVTDSAKFQHGWHHSIKGATIFNDRLIELQKEFATQFFTHRNPYTGLRYVDDPAVAVVEITNENSVFYFSNTSLTLPVYVDELKSRWNRWLTGRYGNRAALARAWTRDGQCALLPQEDPAKGNVILPMKHLYQDPGSAPVVGERSPLRVNAMTRYFFDLERRYYGEIRAHLKRIGVRVPITGTNQTFCPASVYADSVNDFVSRNNYWCHPNVHGKPFFTYRNHSVLASDLPARSNPMTNVASSTVLGRPMISPEFNFPWPIDTRAECLPMMAAYACLQDWDGLLFFAYNPTRRHLEWFGNQSDPVRWGQFPATAILFHRGDVAVARKTVLVSYDEENAFTAGPSHIRSKRSPFRYYTYRSKVRTAFGTQAIPESADAQRVESDTGELVIDTEKQLFTIDTPRTQGVVGHLGNGPVELRDIAVTCRTPFAAILVTSLDDKPIAESSRLLITAVARAENTGQATDRNKSRMPERGGLPVLAEPVDATLALPVKDYVATPLDHTGRRREPLPAGPTLELKGARSPWVEVLRK